MDPVVILGLTIAYASVHALLSILVLRDAERRGIENSVLWAASVVVFSVIGLGMYLIRRIMPERETERGSSNEAPGADDEDAAFLLPGTERSTESSHPDE